MEYLDEHFPEPPLCPANDRELTQMHQWVARQESIQRPLAALSHEFLLLALDDGAERPSRSTVAGCVRGVDCALAEVNRHLAGRTWIVGSALSLADVAWMGTVHRFVQMRFPMGRYGDLRAWYRRVRRLTSFQQAVLAYEPPAVRRRFGMYVLRRWIMGSYVGAAKWRSARLLADA
jgi:glutathione S-transferase